MASGDSGDSFGEKNAKSRMAHSKLSKDLKSVELFLSGPIVFAYLFLISQ